MKQGWNKKPVGDICKILNGFAFKSNEYVEDGVRVMRITNVQKGYIVDDDPQFFPINRENEISKYMLSDGDLLMSLTGNVGRVGVLTSEFLPAALNQRVACLRIKESTGVNLKYLFHIFNSKTFEDDCIINATGIAQKNMSTKWLENYLIPVPPIAEQEKIVAELDCLSGIIEKKKQQLKELDALAQSIFYEMFGNPVENDKGWKVLKLKELSSLIINGTTPKGGAEVYVDNGILFLRSQNVWRNHIDYEDVAHIDEKTNASMKKSILHKHDILITKTGRINTENSSLGRAALFEGETGSANINGHVYLIRINEKLVLPRFVLSILTGIAYRDYIRKVCVGGIDKRQINKEHVEEFPIIIPSVSMQKQYVETVEAIEKQKELIKQSIQETETLFNSRMDYYFN